VLERQRPLLERLGLGIEHPDLVAGVLAKPVAILGVDAAAARHRVRCGYLPELRFAGRRIDVHDVAAREVADIRTLRADSDLVAGVHPSWREIRRAVPWEVSVNLHRLRIHAREARPDLAVRPGGHELTTGAFDLRVLLGPRI